MAPLVNSSEIKLSRKSFVMERKPLMMLKDFLRDDFSSCSSNGFKSFPRRQCCTTVRFLIERDLKTRDSTSKKQLLKKSRSKAASSTMSALQRASEVVINAVKHLPFPSVKSPSSSSVQNSMRKGLLPRSLSRKMLKRSFWNKTEKEEREIQRWRLFQDFLQEKQEPSDSITIKTDTTITIAAATTTTTTASTSTTSNSNSWSDSDSEFTSDYLPFSSGDSEYSGENGASEGKKKSLEKKYGARVGVEVGEDSTEEGASAETCSVKPNPKNEWPTEEEKEQFSPVSVLDCPFDDEEEICSPFQHSLSRIEGKKQKLMQKIRRFESLAQLEPVDLEKRIALSEVEDNETLESPKQSCSNDNAMFLENDKEAKAEQKAHELLDLVKSKNHSDNFKIIAEEQFLDFFREKIESRNVKIFKSGGDGEFEQGLLKVAEDWVNGQPHEMLLLDWQVEESRKAYIRDMEEGGKWRKFDEEEKEDVGLDVEVGVWTCLINELVLDLFSN